MEYQRATKSAQKDQLKTSSSSRHQASLNRVKTHPLLQLQRTIGNQAVLNLLRSQNTHIDASTQTFSEPRFDHDFSRIPVYASRPPMLQTKLKVNQPGDVYEQEADQVAEQVMRMANPEASVSDEDDEANNSLMRKQSGEPQASAATQAPDVPPIVHSVLSSGGGQPLDATTRAFMEPRFGHDFSQVRVHTDERAAESARSVGALAYTVGRDMMFDTGKYAPATRVGQHLLAHELVHIVQQKGTHTLISTVMRKEKTSVHPRSDDELLGLAMNPDDLLEIWKHLTLKEQKKVYAELIGLHGNAYAEGFMLNVARSPKINKRTFPRSQQDLAELARRPRLALDIWKDLDDNEQGKIVIAMIERYGRPFADEFQNAVQRLPHRSGPVDVSVGPGYGGQHLG